MPPSLVIGVGLLLVGATLLSLAWRRYRPDDSPLFPARRLRIWWTMIAVFALAKTGGPTVTIVGFAFLSLVALREYLLHLPRALPASTRGVCYLCVPLQYWWILSDWYGMFVIFIPVFLFLYLPTTRSSSDERQTPLADQALLHWGMMMTVFCLSHAAYLMVLPNGPALLFVVTVLTEITDSVRLLLARTSWGLRWAPLLCSLVATGTALALAPAATAIQPVHAALAGFVLGLACLLGHLNTSNISRELQVAPEGGLERIESLAYTAPLFFHGYRYFYLP